MPLGFANLSLMPNIKKNAKNIPYYYTAIQCKKITLVFFFCTQEFGIQMVCFIVSVIVSRQCLEHIMTPLRYTEVNKYYCF